MTPELAATDSGVRRIFRAPGWLKRCGALILRMAPRKHADTTEKQPFDISTMGWRGFVTAILGYLALGPMGGHLPNDPAIERIEKKLELVQKDVDRIDERVRNFINGYSDAAPNGRRK